MGDKLIINERGTITLPAKMRQNLGLKAGDVLEIEEKNGQLLLRPTVTLPVRMYTDEEIKRWTTADTMSAKEQADYDAWILKKKKKA